jgi:PAS domain S-box-containing protein
VAHGQFALADQLGSQGRRDEAVQLLDEVIRTHTRYANYISLWYSLVLRSQTRQALGHMGEAMSDAQRALELTAREGMVVYRADNLRRLAELHSAAGDSRKAYDLTVQASELTARLNREKVSDRMVQLAQRYKTESKQREIDELMRRNEQQTTELKQRELQQRWLWTVTGGIAVALGGVAFFLLRLRQSHRSLEAANAQLQRSQEDIRALNAGLEQRVQTRTAELRQQARYLRTLIDMLPMWAWFKDTQSRYLVTNQAHAASLGHAVEEVVGRSDLELLPPENAKPHLADDAEVMDSQQRKTAEVAVDVDGCTVWMETYKAAVLDEDGTVLGTVGMARDISERKAAEAAREAALAEAERLAQMRSDFLAQMSHELRTPLNGILGFAQILQDDQDLTERQARGLGIIEKSGQHLLALINDILDLARIDAGKLELTPAELDLPNFLQTVSDIIRVKADEKGLAYRCEGSELPPSVTADDMRLRQVLLNLMSNAVKFTDHGQVTLRVQRLGLGTDGRAKLRFEVEDTGVGMTPEQAARLFQPFEQVGDTRRRAEGAGLGLAISRQLVRLMGGEIRLDSQPGRGSRFWFDLELPSGPGGRAAMQPAPQGGQGDFVASSQEARNRVAFGSAR